MTTSQLSLQLYTVRDAIAADLRGALARVAGIGFRQVEPYGFVERADDYAEALADAGLSAPSGHASLLSAPDPIVILDAAQRLGMTTVIDPFVAPEEWTELAAIERTAAKLNALVPAAASRGITVGYHNHEWEIEAKIDGVTALETFAALLDPAVVLEIDTYWVGVGGEPVAALLERLGDQVRFIHVKDGDLSRDTKAQTAVGSGIAPILDTLAAAPDALRVVELDDFDGDVFDAVTDSFAFLTARGVVA